MKIYTRKGDKGETSLFGGTRVLKDAARIEAYGTVDELNSLLGMALAQSPSVRIAECLKSLQQHLFVLGADLATPLDADTRIQRIDKADIVSLEQTIDELSESLPGLRNFILPGGSPCGSSLHLARTVCRRAERRVVSCSTTGSVTAESVIFLNRLSDLLFVMARYENDQTGHIETEWKI